MTITSSVSTQTSFELASCQTMVLRAPIKQAVRTAFGTMRDRPLVLVKLCDTNGVCGWGEVWCNFPSCGAEHRANLIDSEVAQLLVGLRVKHPEDVFKQLTQSLHSLANQSGEHGPIAQIIAAIDIALWDIHAQYAELPLWKLLGGQNPTIKTYTSGINPTKPEITAQQQYEKGFRAFKLKVGFDDDLDLANVRAIREQLGDAVQLMIDANQSWDVETAQRMSDELAKYNLTWLEEPLPVDAPLEQWQQLARTSPIPLAGGENLRGYDGFNNAIDCGVFHFIQPDVAKWGGISGCLIAAKAIRDAGLTYCPHWLGGGVGLNASAHLLAAVGGNGMLEVDSNKNPLRDELIATWVTKDTAHWTIKNANGLGITLNNECFQRYHLAHLSSEDYT